MKSLASNIHFILSYQSNTFTFKNRKEFVDMFEVIVNAPVDYFLHDDFLFVATDCELIVFKFSDKNFYNILDNSILKKSDSIKNSTENTFIASEFEKHAKISKISSIFANNGHLLVAVPGSIQDYIFNNTLFKLNELIPHAHPISHLVSDKTTKYVVDCRDKVTTYPGGKSFDFFQPYIFFKEYAFLVEDSSIFVGTVKKSSSTAVIDLFYQAEGPIEDMFFSDKGGVVGLLIDNNSDELTQPNSKYISIVDLNSKTEMFKIENCSEIVIANNLVVSNQQNTLKTIYEFENDSFLGSVVNREIEEKVKKEESDENITNISKVQRKVEDRINKSYKRIEEEEKKKMRENAEKERKRFKQMKQEKLLEKYDLKNNFEDEEIFHRGNAREDSDSDDFVVGDKSGYVRKRDEYDSEESLVYQNYNENYKERRVFTKHSIRGVNKIQKQPIDNFLNNYPTNNYIIPRNPSSVNSKEANLLFFNHQGFMISLPGNISNTITIKFHDNQIDPVEIKDVNFCTLGSFYNDKYIISNRSVTTCYFNGLKVLLEEPVDLVGINETNIFLFHKNFLKLFQTSETSYELKEPSALFYVGDFYTYTIGNSEIAIFTNSNCMILSTIDFRAKYIPCGVVDFCGYSDEDLFVQMNGMIFQLKNDIFVKIIDISSTPLTIYEDHVISLKDMQLLPRPQVEYSLLRSQKSISYSQGNENMQTGTFNPNNY